jgi:hypothetical protein
MDLVTKNLVDTFKNQQNLADDIDGSTLFEHFANFCVVSKEYTEEFDVEDIHVAGGNDLQLDGMAIMVNGVLIRTKEEVDDLLKINKNLNVEFIFIQAKTGSDFSGAEISNMFYGVRELFADTPSLPRNEALADKEAIARYIYQNSAFFRHGNPAVKLYYATTGKWENDKQLEVRVNTELETLEELNILNPLLYSLQ